MSSPFETTAMAHICTSASSNTSLELPGAWKAPSARAVINHSASKAPLSEAGPTAYVPAFSTATYNSAFASSRSLPHISSCASQSGCASGLVASPSIHENLAAFIAVDASSSSCASESAFASGLVASPSIDQNLAALVAVDSVSACSISFSHEASSPSSSATATPRVPSSAFGSNLHNTSSNSLAHVSSSSFDTFGSGFASSPSIYSNLASLCDNEPEPKLDVPETETQKLPSPVVNSPSPVGNASNSKATPKAFLYTARRTPASPSTSTSRAPSVSASTPTAASKSFLYTGRRAPASPSTSQAGPTTSTSTPTPTAPQHTPLAPIPREKRVRLRVRSASSRHRQSSRSGKRVRRSSGLRIAAIKRSAVLVAQQARAWVLAQASAEARLKEKEQKEAMEKQARMEKAMRDRILEMRVARHVEEVKRKAGASRRLAERTREEMAVKALIAKVVGKGTGECVEKKGNQIQGGHAQLQLSATMEGPEMELDDMQWELV
ncbi:hypothetical protein C8F01DRAFT_549295 [Mycena amicta]|nr:hypothetical protein C8F01DRAFT_549295 [Mycena amicta]